jgi:DNA-binding PadR family transcriptional regulator
MDVSNYLPLSESTFYILLSLDEPRHGYGIMQRVADMSGGEVRIGPGTLYGAFTMLEKQKLIVMVREEDRRKIYALTADGTAVLQAQLARTKRLLGNAGWLAQPD